MTEDVELLELELLAIQRRKNDLLRLQYEEKKSNALGLYQPHPFQEKFHSAGEFGSRLAEAGNRSGKSEMGAAEDAAWLLGERRWIPKGDPRRILGIPNRPVKGMVICTTWRKVREVYTDETPGTEGKLLKYLPPDEILFTKRTPEAIYFIALKNGSSITFTTVEQYKKNPQTMESSDWDFIHVDEPCPEAMFKAASRGLIDREGSKAWFTLTPLNEPWISDMFFPNVEKHEETSTFDKDGIPNRWAISFSMFDNPHNSPRERDRFIESLTEEEKECRVYGKPFNLVGLVYREFSPDRHILREKPKSWPQWDKPPSDWSHYIWIDPHPQTPFMVSFWAVPPTGGVYLYDEIFQKLPPTLVARQIVSRLGNAHLVEAYMDPLGFQEHPETGECFADFFYKEGLPVLKAPKDLSSGIMIAKEKLLLNDYIRVSPRCERFLWEIRRYRWDVDKRTGAPLNKPVDKDDHAMENFYRAMLTGMPYCDPSDYNVRVPEQVFTERNYSLGTVSYAI